MTLGQRAIRHGQGQVTYFGLVSFVVHRRIRLKRERVMARASPPTRVLATFLVAISERKVVLLNWCQRSTGGIAVHSRYVRNNQLHSVMAKAVI